MRYIFIGVVLVLGGCAQPGYYGPPQYRPPLVLQPLALPQQPTYRQPLICNTNGGSTYCF